MSAVDNQSAANVDADELARLRAEHEELLRLRGEAGKLRRMEADAARMQAENARLRTAQPDKSSAKSPEQIEEEREAFKYFAIAKMSHAKAWGLAFVLFADENGGLMPKTFEAAAKHLPASDSESALRVQDQFEIVFQGALKDLEKPNATIIVREKTPFTSLAQPDSPNKIWRAYGFADGHSEFHGTPDGDFEAWEKEHLAQPLPR